MKEPLPLDSPRWGELSHAYGKASDIPELLRQLRSYPPGWRYDEDPWFTLWSSLCHQGDVHTASYAAVPHILTLASARPELAHYQYFLLPASIEGARAAPRAGAPDIPADLADAYWTSWRLVPGLVTACSARPWDEDFARSIAAALCAAQGQPALVDHILRDREDDDA